MTDIDEIIIVQPSWRKIFWTTGVSCIHQASFVHTNIIANHPVLERTIVCHLIISEKYY